MSIEEHGCERLRNSWKFARGEQSGAERCDFDDRSWKTVQVPHDWAISGPFGPQFDKQVAAIEEGGRIKVMYGRTAGLPHVGVGWYRRQLDIDSAALKRAGEGARVYLEFDGVMSNSDVYVNGRRVGGWPYGYTSFVCDATSAIDVGGGPNVVAVRCENQPASSRWYPGAGIYRDARLRIAAAVHIDTWGVFVTTPRVSQDAASVEVQTELVLGGDGQVELSTTILDEAGQTVAEANNRIDSAAGGEVGQTLTVSQPRLWDVDAPHLYRAISRVLLDGRVVDRRVTSFGIRSIAFEAERGFMLNGRPVRLKGVCLHHDLGPLGAAFSMPAAERQLEIMKRMGCNAVRMSHNPAAPGFLDLCDRMGLLVINEAFDVWADRKTLTGYHVFFNQWAERDLAALIRRDRNHPSVIMWCIGNEVVEQDKPHGAQIARQLTAISHRLDSTRPTTAGFSHGDAAIANGLAAEVDVPGWNYHPGQYERFRREHPTWPMYGSETVSCISSRGEYYFPVVKAFAEESSTPWRRSFHCSSYDLDWRGCIPDIELAAQEDNPSIFGEFVWTGFDYLGEPTPYREVWPSRSSYYGIVDLAGLPKDRYYLYQSIWSAEPVLHLLPHWNWQGMEGQSIPVHCYTSYEAAELFLNGRSLGICRKDKSKEIGRFRLIWDVPYESGVLRVVALDADGRHVAEAERRTAGPADHIELVVDRQVLSADGEDLMFATATVCDKDGTICPRASDRMNFLVDGEAEVIATCNGDQTCLEPFQNPHKKAFNGCCVAIIRATIGAGKGTAALRVEAEGLRSGQVEISIDRRT